MRVDLTRVQSTINRDRSRFRVVVAGRRTGKTTLALIEHVCGALESPGWRSWHIGPTYRQAKRFAWKPLKALCHRRWLKKTPNESELLIEFANGSEIQLLGADDPDSLRGPGLDFVGLDEYAFMVPQVWDEAVRPMLSDRAGRALFTTTPKGFNWAYDLYLRGVDPAETEWSAHQYTTAEGGIVPLEEVERARAEMDLRTFRQEYEASFETMAGRVYDNFDRRFNVTDEADDPGPDPETGVAPEILVGIDFNVNPMSAVLATRAADECHVFDALEIMTSNTEELARELRHRYPKRELVALPDPSGSARKTSAPVGVTDHSILRAHGFTVRGPNRAPPVVDRVNNTQAMLADAKGRRRLLVHPRAQKLVRAWDGLTYKEGTSQVDKTLGLDHIADAADYLIWSEFNLLVRREVDVGNVAIV